MSSRLQRDHRVPFAQGGPTALDNLDWYCDFHHLLKTKGWIRVGGRGNFRLVPPGTKVEQTDSGDGDDTDKSASKGVGGGERAPP